MDLISQRIKTVREDKGLTQAQLSEHMGFTDRQTLSAIESGQRKVSAEELLGFMKALEVNLEFLTDPFLLVGEQTDLSDQTILEAQRFFAEALAQEYNAIVQYNNALARFEYAKGTMLHHNNIVIGEGPLPHCAAERAADHHARRAAALVLKEKAAPIHCSDGSCAPGSKEHLLPNLPQYRPASLPIHR